MEDQNQVPEQKNRFPKWLTTVTPFSKALAMILFIAFPFIGFYLGMRYQQLTVSTPVVSEVQKTAIPTPTPTAIHPSTACNTDSDCQNGAKCMVTGPIIASQPVHKICVQKGKVIPL